MSFQVINPATGETVKEIPVWDDASVEATLSQVAAATPGWASTPIAERCELMRKAGQVLRDNKKKYAQIITTEMGKLIKDAQAEVEKCALVCDYYAEHGHEFLKDEVLTSDASHSFVAYLP